MIVEAICSLIFALFNFVISLFPSLPDFVIPSEIFDTFNWICSICGYFLPIKHIGIIFGFWIIFTNFRLIYAIIMRIWDALPFT